MSLVSRDDDRRCDAVATSTGHRCALVAFRLQDGRLVCFRHFKQPTVKYICGDRVGAYREMMAIALGDDAGNRARVPS